MKINNTKKGFSLIEVIVAVAIIVMVVFSATSLLVSIIRSNKDNVNTLIAYGLAQEGLEAVRNIRDSNWLLGASFEGAVGTRVVSQPWGETFPENEGDIKNYTIDYLEPGTIKVNTSAELSNVAPWVLTVLSSEGDPGMDDQTQLYKTTSQLFPETRYTHNGGDEKTPFHRYVTITREEEKKYRVTSIVNWQEGVRQREVRLDTELTNWKEGQL